MRTFKVEQLPVLLISHEKPQKGVLYHQTNFFLIFCNVVDIFLPYGLNLIIDKTLQHGQKNVFHLHDLEPFHNI